jgi:ketosteroid isomerase-like protein
MATNDPSLDGKVEVADSFREYFAHFKITSFAESDRHETLLGDWAVERWSYQLAIQPTAGGDRILDEGRLLLVWKRSAKDEWQIAQQMWNSSRPIGSGTSRFMSLLKQRFNTPK